MNTTVVKVRRLISKNKAIAAAVTAFGGVLTADLVSLIVTGDVNVAETRTAAGAFALALLTYGVTYMTSAGDAEVSVPAVAPVSEHSSWGADSTV